VSHTGVRGTCDNARNLTDRQLQQIAQTGGVIGIGFWKTAVCGDRVEAIAKAIRYAVNLVGVEHVALGSDFDGAVRLPMVFDRPEVIGSHQLVQITAALQDANFSEPEIKQIMGMNTIQLLQRLLPA
jgi:membrane dipeptidase